LRFCAAGYETTLDNLVEVTFTVSPRVRKIAAHNPTNCPRPNIIARSSGVRPSIFQPIWRSCCADHARRRRLAAGRKGHLSLELPKGTLIVFDPVTHTAQFLDVSGEEASERQNLS
jgi:hypothetical protein